MARELGLYVVAAIIRDTSNRLLMVRKRHTVAFLNPGGKPENGESDVEALKRELREEVGVETTACVHFKKYYGISENEGVPITLNIFEVNIVGVPVASAEIEEVVWLASDYSDHGIVTAKMFHQIERDLIEMSIW
jgi:8-oxo-dGTP diphosphatase